MSTAEPPASVTAGERLPPSTTTAPEASDASNSNGNGHGGGPVGESTATNLPSSSFAEQARALGERKKADGRGPGPSDGFFASDAMRFAPLSIPRHRRLQTMAVAFWGTLLPISLCVFFLLLSIPVFWPLIAIYLVWLAFDKAPETGGRRFEWARRLRVWRYFAEYYPISLIKSADLPADRKYIFGYHPHGIIGMGAVCNFATCATEFPTSFPGIVPHLLTLSSNFKIPIYRDLLMALGICSVSRKSCENILRKGPGNAVTIVIGGAAESLHARPGTADLTLRRRLGFIKIAIRSGADLVPVFAMGENEIFLQLGNDPGTKLHSFQKAFQRTFGFTLPIFRGRGVFNYSFGILPFRHPIVAVAGRPIKVQQKDSPTREEIVEVQRKYIQELYRIWDQWKDLYAANRTRELTIID